MDAAIRSTVRMARDAAVRRSLGLPGGVSRHRAVRGSTSRRWTDGEIKTAVLKAGNGRRMRPEQYKQKRVELDPTLYPSYDTVRMRRPDLFL